MIEILECEQNSPEWLEARRGIPTASAFSQLLAKGEGKTRRSYMLKLAGEIITGKPDQSWTGNEHTERGHELESEVRDMYAFQALPADVATMRRVGFIKNGLAGCSPDSLIGEDGGLEIKTKLPHLLIELILADKFPADHVAQVQGTLWVTGRKWWDIAVGWPGMPLFKKRAFRDEAYIANLAQAVAAFTVELDATVKAVRAHGGNSTLAADLKASAA